MKLKLTKANAFQIDPGKKYLVMIVTDESLWTDEQKQKLNESLASLNMTTVLLPLGSKFKIVEAPNE
jgi:hypothetical protein